MIDGLTDYVSQNFGAKGLAWFKVDSDGKLASPIAKNFSEPQLAAIAERMDAAAGDLLLFVADGWDVTCRALAGLRKRLAGELKLYRPGEMHFSWVVEFPMFELDEESNRWVAKHHPFTAPRPSDLPLLEEDPGSSCRRL